MIHETEFDDTLDYFGNESQSLFPSSGFYDRETVNAVYHLFDRAYSAACCGRSFPAAACVCVCVCVCVRVCACGCVSQGLDWP